MRVNLNNRKLYKVFILYKVLYEREQQDQDTMAKLYMNRFAIEEDDQFEIHVKDINTYYWVDNKKTTSNVVKEVMLKAQQGSDDFHLN